MYTKININIFGETLKSFDVLSTFPEKIIYYIYLDLINYDDVSHIRDN